MTYITFILYKQIIVPVIDGLGQFYETENKIYWEEI